MTSATLSHEDRAAFARAVLARAERRTGARSVLTTGHPESPERPAVPELHAVPDLRPVPTEPEPVPAVREEPRPVPAPPASAQSAPPRASLLTSERPPLPVPPPLAPLLPDGLRRGATTAVTGSTSLLLEVLAHACAGGAWAVAVGMPTLGLLAAAQAGLELDRLALVPRPGAEAATVVAALLDGIDVVVVGPDVALVDADRRRLSARARDRGAVLLATGDWPGASVVLTVDAGRWDGLGDGDGRLRSHTLHVVRSGRGGAAQVAALDLVLPLGSVRPEAIRDEEAGTDRAAEAAQAPAPALDDAVALLAPEADLPVEAEEPDELDADEPAHLRLVG
jgi:hypothetical protein